MEIYILRDNQQFGPYSESEFLKYLGEQSIIAPDLAWAAEWGNEWLTVTEAEKRVRHAVSELNHDSVENDLDSSQVHGTESTTDLPDAVPVISEANRANSLIPLVVKGSLFIALLTFIYSAYLLKSIWGGGYSGPILLCEPAIEVSQCESDSTSLSCNIKYPGGGHSRPSFNSKLTTWAYDKNGVKLAENSHYLDIAAGSSEKKTLIYMSAEDWKRVTEVRICSVNPKSSLGQALDWKRVQ